MQPYLFPYLGYFQLIHAVDVFVVYDDVNYIKGGRINRNHILSNDGKQIITLPLSAASPNKLINEIKIEGRHKILQSITYNYKKAPHFNTIYPMIEDIFSQTTKNLTHFLYYQLQKICAYLDLNPMWRISSSLKKDNKLHGVEKVLAICKEIGATHYINAPGGRSLYDSRMFAEQGITLSFIQSENISYPQFGKDFTANLSIIDVMMFNDKLECTRLLGKYALD